MGKRSKYTEKERRVWDVAFTQLYAAGLPSRDLVHLREESAFRAQLTVEAYREEAGYRFNEGQES